MPFYIYECNNCKIEIEVFHLMKEAMADNFCNKCESGRLIKQIATVERGEIKVPENSKPGNIVKEFIDSSKQSLKIEKDNLKKRKRE